MPKLAPVLPPVVTVHASPMDPFAPDDAHLTPVAQIRPTVGRRGLFAGPVTKAAVPVSAWLDRVRHSRRSTQPTTLREARSTRA